VRCLWQRRPPEPEADPPVPDDTPTDPLVFETFEHHGVDYVAVGGSAVQSHGHPRTTRDVDVLVGPEPENLVRLGRRLASFGRGYWAWTRICSASTPPTPSTCARAPTSR
jgi:hypothetical protein